MGAGGQRRVNHLLTKWEALQQNEAAIALWMQGRELAARFFDEIGPMPDPITSSEVIGWADYSGLGVAAPALRFPLKRGDVVTVFMEGDRLQKCTKALSLQDLDWPETVNHFMLSPELERDVARWREYVQEVVGT